MLLERETNGAPTGRPDDDHAYLWKRTTKMKSLYARWSILISG